MEVSEASVGTITGNSKLVVEVSFPDYPSTNCGLQMRKSLRHHEVGIRPVTTYADTMGTPAIRPRRAAPDSVKRVATGINKTRLSSRS